MPLVPWHDVVKVYSNLLLDVDISNRSHLYLVAPDVIGDRDATHQLWESYRLRLEHLAARGAHVIFPLQRSSHGLLGSLIEDASSSWRLAQSIAGHRAVAGIPYSKRAWSLDEVQDLFRSIRIPKAHLLGVGAPAKINAIYGFLSQSLSDDHFPDLSADAAVIRSMVGTQAHPTPVRKRIAVRTYTIASESVFHDEGEEAIFDQLQASQAKARREILAEALSLPLGTYADLDPIAYRTTVTEAAMPIMDAA
ncbi:MAG: hypothetical protein PF961_06915 [Planctomycetota bacterium]|nr:hypothetical protein [Planctomycetota bacterium]